MENKLEGWLPEARLVNIKSSLDQSEQPCVYYAPPRGSKPFPLLVSLHTWSADYTQRQGQRLQWCIDKEWVFVNPNFRGANKRREAMGSDLAVQDVIDAIEYAKRHSEIDTDRIYALGFSGGGHMAMLMAGRHPDVWAGVSAWCGISDISAWHTQKFKTHYARHIEASLGGDPRDNPDLAEAASHRSPVTWLHQATRVPLDIYAGIHDGHTGSVPISHSLHGFNCVAKPEDRIAEDDINQITADRVVPDALKSVGSAGKVGNSEIHFSRQSGWTRITIFEGGHTGFNVPALQWLEKQRRDTDPVWETKIEGVQDPAGDADMRGN